MEKINDPQYQKDLERIQKLRPIDDEFMRCMFKDNIPLAEYVLREILNKPDLKVTKLETQRDLKKLAGSRSICLDAFCVDSEGKQYDIEIQRHDKGADPHRARYHLSALDVENLKSGQEFKELPETYIIFITEKDFFDDGEAVYNFDRINTKTLKPLNDGTHIVYVNSDYVGESELAKLLHDFKCSNPNDMYNKLMADSARYYKEDSKGVSEMSRILEDMREESRREGEIKGKKEGKIEGKMEQKIETVIKMLTGGILNTQQISEYSGLSIDEIEKIKIGLAN